MARIGVDYDTIKHAAFKLLSQGRAPSVQRIRNLLGTGSNTTIAEHLNAWREEHASREIHHLPANMPRELISAIEVLWQVAMEQASNQLGEVKKDLTTQQEQLKQDQQNTEKAITEIKATLAQKEQALLSQDNTIKSLQTKLAIEQERLLSGKKEKEKTEKQHEIKLQNAIDEKHHLLDQYHKSQADLATCQQALSTQAGKNQQQLSEERQRQEQSENRWVKMIDRSRQEADNLRKQFEQYKQQNQKTSQKLSNEVFQLQHERLVHIKHRKADAEQIKQLEREGGALVAKLDKLKSKKAKKNTKVAK